MYKPKDTPLDELPESLQQLFTPHTEVTTLHVTAERKLARLQGAELLQHFAEDGYYLQLPINPENWLEEYKTRPRSANSETS